MNSNMQNCTKSYYFTIHQITVSTSISNTAWVKKIHVIFLFSWYFFSKFKNRNQTKPVSHIFLKTEIKPNLVGSQPNWSVRFGQGISPVGEAKCLGHFASPTGEMAQNSLRGHFASPTCEMASYKKFKKLVNENEQQNWNFFKKEPQKLEFFYTTINLEFRKFRTLF